MAVELFFDCLVDLSADITNNILFRLIPLPVMEAIVEKREMSILLPVYNERIRGKNVLFVYI